MEVLKESICTPQCVVHCVQGSTQEVWTYLKRGRTKQWGYLIFYPQILPERGINESDVFAA